MDFVYGNKCISYMEDMLVFLYIFKIFIYLIYIWSIVNYIGVNCYFDFYYDVIIYVREEMINVEILM